MLFSLQRYIFFYNYSKTLPQYLPNLKHTERSILGPLDICITCMGAMGKKGSLWGGKTKTTWAKRYQEAFHLYTTIGIAQICETTGLPATSTVQRYLD